MKPLTTLKHLILLASLSAPLLCAAAPLVPRIARRVETSDVRSQKLELVYGETVDLEVKFLAYGVTMDIAGAAVRLHARTNGMEEGVSWQTSGEAGGDGTATVRIDVDAWLPAGMPAGTWTLEVAQTNSAKILRGGGTLTLTGTGAGLTNAPLPASVANELWAAIYGTNALLWAAITNTAPDHAAASNLEWTVSGHYGTAGRLAIFSEGGMAGYSAPGSGLYLDGSDNLHVSNSVIEGAALGATAVQTESDPVAMAALAGYQSAAYWPPDATASSWFNFVTNSGAITITGYNIEGGTAVIIPDYINGWPVTTIGVQAFRERGVTSIGGAGNVVTVEDYAFMVCTSLVSVLLPRVQTVGADAFYNCTSLASVSPPHVQTVEGFAFEGCTSLTSLYFTGNAPTIGAEIFAGINTNQVTVYVTNPQATGWGAKFGDMPVVRLDLHGKEIYKDGLPVATEAHVAEQIAAMPVPDLSSRVAVTDGTATNLTTRGWLALPQTVAGTNLTYRLVVSNDVILAIGVWQ